MPGLLLPTASNVRPSYKSGFARSAAESSSPGLWRKMVGCWSPLLGNSGTQILPDLSGHGKHATLTNFEGTDWQQSRYGSALDFDGLAEYGTITDGSDFAFSEIDFTITALVKFDVVNAYQNIITKYDSNNDFWRLMLWNDGRVAVSINTTDAFSTSSLSADTWYHIAYVADQSANGQIFINGVADGAADPIASQTLNLATTTTTIGATPSGGGQLLNGQLGYVMLHQRLLLERELRQLYRDPLAPFRQRRFTPTYPTAAAAAATTSVGWTRSLTPSPVRPSYKSGFARSAAESSSPGLWKGLVGIWSPFLGSSGTVLRELSGRHDDGTFTGLTGSDWTASKHGPTFLLNGGGDAVVTTSPGVLGQAASTVVVWFSTISTDTADNCLVGYGTNDTGTQYVLTVENGVIWNRFGVNTVSGGSGFNDGAWHYVACVKPRNGKTSDCRLYVDGTELSTTPTGSTTLNMGSTEPVSLGSPAVVSGYRFNGYLGTAAIYDCELSLREINQYRDPLAPFRQRRFTPTISGAAEAAGWQPYWGLHATRFAGILT